MKNKSIKKKLKIPIFKNEDKERDFWKKTDLSNYFDTVDFEEVSFPNLKPSSHPISLRMPDYLLMRLKERANALDIPYQSLIKQYIAEGVLRKENLKTKNS